MATAFCPCCSRRLPTSPQNPRPNSSPNPSPNTSPNPTSTTSKHSVSESLASSSIRDVKITEDSFSRVYSGCSCSICMEDFALNQEVSHLPCKHFFHGKCIGKWIKKSKTCPLCRCEFSVQPSKEVVVHENESQRQTLLQGYEHIRLPFGLSSHAPSLANGVESSRRNIPVSDQGQIQRQSLLQGYGHIRLPLALPSHAPTPANVAQPSRRNIPAIDQEGQTQGQTLLQGYRHIRLPLALPSHAPSPANVAQPSRRPVTIPVIVDEDGDTVMSEA